MRSELNKMEKKWGGTKKKVEESGHGVAHKKSGEWFESFVQRDVAANKTPSFASMNRPHHHAAATSLRRLHSQASCMNDINGCMEDGDKYNNSGEVTTENCDAPGFCWDMRMGEMGLGEGSQSIYWDEEEVFNMPALINSMAEGLLIAPPALQTGFNWLPPETPFHFTLWAD